ncbi:Uncharacterised protein [Mycobacteroides abscessus subsp. abscessus]|uniref:hypothetical protein n=1 Tax=Mycobacteroides abscessus TaxID=36809 RepID=UPI000927141B|nr:hypothetical protein [Mycobacteroides abscessus]SIF60651.1 Uncharacterised protein [Mycobacteroides abscessus subsp. abscessus]
MTTPTDLIDLRTAAELLGPEPVGIAGLIAAGKLTEHHVNGGTMLSRQQVIDVRFRAAGLVPAGEAR